MGVWTEAFEIFPELGGARKWPSRGRDQQVPTQQPLLRSSFATRRAGWHVERPAAAPVRSSIAPSDPQEAELRHARAGNADRMVSVDGPGLGRHEIPGRKQRVVRQVHRRVRRQGQHGRFEIQLQQPACAIAHAPEQPTFDRCTGAEHHAVSSAPRLKQAVNHGLRCAPELSASQRP